MLYILLLNCYFFLIKGCLHFLLMDINLFRLICCVYMHAVCDFHWCPGCIYCVAVQDFILFVIVNFCFLIVEFFFSACTMSNLLCRVIMLNRGEPLNISERFSGLEFCV
jgi:hypothetical protein